MSDTSKNTAHDEEHTGPVKTPKQLLLAVLYSFVVPVFAIIALVYFVTADKKPAEGAANPEKALAARIQKVGVVEKVLTGAAALLKSQFVAPENAGEQGDIKDRAEADAGGRPMFRPGQLP